MVDILAKACIIHHMKVIKLNSKYANYPRWKFAMEFGRTKYQHADRVKYAAVFRKLYGPSQGFNPEYSMSGKLPYYLFNENWYNDTERGRICFNNESDVTAVMLLLTAK